MTRHIDTSLDHKRRCESESEEVAKKPRKGSSWKGKRKRKDMDTAEFTRKRKNLNRGLYFSQVCLPSIKVRRTGAAFFTPLTLTAILAFSVGFPEVVFVISDGECQCERVSSQSTRFRFAVSVLLLMKT